MMTTKAPMRLRDDRVTVTDVADASRDALHAFVVMPPRARELGEWLAGPYAHATSFVLGANPTVLTPRGEWTTAEVITRAQAVIAKAIDASTSPGADELVRSLPPVVHVRPVVDVYLARGFAPFDQPRATLVDRALSLLVGDYLTRPDDFLAVVPSWRRTFERRESGFSARVDVLPLPVRKTLA